jgi:hypothetical protein
VTDAAVAGSLSPEAATRQISTWTRLRVRRVYPALGNSPTSMAWRRGGDTNF